MHPIHSVFIFVVVTAVMLPIINYAFRKSSVIVFMMSIPAGLVTCALYVSIARYLS